MALEAQVRRIVILLSLSVKVHFRPWKPQSAEAGDHSFIHAASAALRGVVEPLPDGLLDLPFNVTLKTRMGTSWPFYAIAT